MQARHSAWFGSRRAGPAVWFKAVGKPNLREFPITLALARLFPQYIPPILAARPEWNGWLALEVEGTNLGETQDAQHWNTAASALAKLQIESIGRIGALIDSGARDLRASALLKLVRPFLDAMGQLMEKQTKVPPPVLSRSELVLLGEQIEEALSLSTDLGIPDALGHLDLNPGNVIVSEGHCVFLDWAEAYVGNPLFSFQYLVEHFRRMAGVNVTAESGLTSAYAQKWQSLVSPERLAEALGSGADAGGLCLRGRERCVVRRGETSGPQDCRISTESDAADASRSKPAERSECAMPKLMEPPPCSPVEPVTEVLHGVTVTDPYRWLEDQDSAQTRAWLEAQTEYARAYLDSIPGRERIRQRIRELLDVETYDSVQKVGQRYFFPQAPSRPGTTLRLLTRRSGRRGLPSHRSC